MTNVHSLNPTTPLPGMAEAVRTLQSNAGSSSRIQVSDEAQELRDDEIPEDRNNEVGGIAADRLRSIVERVENLEEEKKAISDGIKDVMLEAKSAGFNPKVLKHIIRIRKMEPGELAEQETLLDLYRRALGMD